MLLSLTRVGWGGGHPAFRRVFANLFVPEAMVGLCRYPPRAVSSCR